MAESIESSTETRARFVRACEAFPQINDAATRELWTLAVAWRAAASDKPGEKASALAALERRCVAFGVPMAIHPGDKLLSNRLAKQLVDIVATPPLGFAHPLVYGSKESVLAAAKSNLRPGEQLVFSIPDVKSFLDADSLDQGRLHDPSTKAFAMDSRGNVRPLVNAKADRDAKIAEMRRRLA